MKGENKSWKSYSACITLNHCLLIILIVISCVNYSHGFRQRSSSFKARVFEDYQDPLERYPKIFGDDGREFPPEDVTNKPSQDELSSTVNYPSGCSSSICVMIPTYTPFPLETSEEYIPSTVQYPNERRFTEDHNTMKTQESIWIGESTTDSTFTEANPYSEPIQRTTDYGIASTWSSVESNWPTVNCGADEFSCHSKRLCIKSHLVCDGINDCDDGSDEFECESATQTFSSDSIRMIGEPDRSQPRCAEWDPKNMACKHHKGKLPLIVFSTLNALYETSLPEDRTKIHVNETTQQINLSGISVFDYDHFDDAVFWLDTSENKIFRAPFLPIEMIRIGSGEIEINFEIDRRNIVIYGTHKIHGFVYDWMRHALIWIDDYGIRSKEFYRDETRLYRTLDPSYDRPGSITIDVKKRYIFWTNIGADPSRPFDFPKYIQRIDINDLSEQYGEPRTEKIVKTNILCPIGLAIDTKNTKVYWIDGLYGTLESIGYDGTNRTILYESLPFMYELISMDILSNYLYFTDRANSTIQRININNEVKKVDTLVSVPNGPPTWVKIIKH